MAVKDKMASSHDYLLTTNKEIDENPHYTAKDRNTLSKQAFHNYGKMMSRDIQGPISTTVRIEAIGTAFGSTMDAVKDWWKR